MALPSEWDDRILKRTYLDDFGDPMTGTVTITATVPVENMTEDKVFYPRPRVVALDGTGTATITVQVADPDMRTSAYTHHVVESLAYPAHDPLPTPAPFRVEYDILVEPGTDPLFYGALAPVAPSTGVALVDPAFQGPPGPAGADGAPGTPGAAGTNGTNGTNGISAYDQWLAAGNTGSPTQFLNSLVGPTGPTGIGKSAYQEWLDLGNTGDVNAFLADLVDISTLLPVKNGTVVLSPAIDQFLHLTILDDATDSATWPNRFEVTFQSTGIPVHLTFWLNEFGEGRFTAAKGTTVPLRLYTRENASGPVHTANMFEIVSDRDLRTPLFTVDSTGKVTAPNIGQKVVAQGTAPTDTTVIWVDTSA